MRGRQRHIHYYAPGRAQKQKSLLTQILSGIAVFSVIFGSVVTVWANDTVTHSKDLAPPTATPTVVRKSLTGSGITGTNGGGSTSAVPYSPVEVATLEGFQYKSYTLDHTSMVDVSDSLGWLATYTMGARTVTVRGEYRRFAEPANTVATIRHNVWVRLLPAPFSGDVDEAWLANTLADKTPDALAIALQYIDTAPQLKDDADKVYAGDANYGPLLPDGTRQEGSDYNDYLGVSVAYDGVSDAPEPNQLNSLDCSGFMRMVWGKRLGLPLASGEASAGTGALPRRAVQQVESAPGIVIQSLGATRILADLRPGDLVFFDASSDDGAAIDHVGMYMGLDTASKHRFISSRKSANGPTLGDTGGKSILEGSGVYANAYRVARRL